MTGIWKPVIGGGGGQRRKDGRPKKLRKRVTRNNFVLGRTESKEETFCGIKELFDTDQTVNKGVVESVALFGVLFAVVLVGPFGVNHAARDGQSFLGVEG
jgi:hypothetical protein